MNLNKLFTNFFNFNVQFAFSEQWVEIGADAEAIYFVDLNSIHKAEDSHTIIKKQFIANIAQNILVHQKSLYFHNWCGGA